MPVFTQRHYDRVAGILHEESLRPMANLSTIDDIFDKFVRMFEGDNPRFDLKKFYQKVWGKLND